MLMSESTSHIESITQSSSDLRSCSLTPSSNRCASQACVKPSPWKRPTAVKLFVCSTGQDMQNEENALIGRVFYQLREYCRYNHALEFHAVNLRWATSARLIGDDHNLMNRICVDAIEECAAQSAGPSFLALVGQRYGECRLPAYIRARDYDVIRSVVGRKASREWKGSVALLDECYELDCNELDQGHYRLKRHFKEKGEDVIAEELKKIICHGVSIGLRECQLESRDAACYTCSDLEKELCIGIQCPTSTTPTHGRHSNRLLVFRRVIADLKNYAELPLIGQRFAEVTCCTNDPNRKHLDPTCEKRIESLVGDVLPVAIGRENVVSRSVLWRHDDGISEEYHSDYIEEMCRTLYNKLVAMIDNSERTTSTNPDSVDSELDFEVEEHRNCAMTEAERFQGQEETLEMVRSYVVSDDRRPLVIFGETGAGKTALLGKAFVQASRWIDNGTLLSIVRFANVTSLSRDLRHVLSTICAEMCSTLRRLGHPMAPPLTTSESGDISAFTSLCYCELVETFHSFLDSFPKGLNLVIFLDGADLLFPGDVVQLDWIPKLVKEHVKLVLGVSNDDGLLIPLKRDIIRSTKNFVELTVMTQSDCLRVLIRELSARYHRCLTNDQLGQVAQKCFSDGAFPLYVKLIACIVHSWTSSDSSDIDALPCSVEAAVNTILERVETKLSGPLVARVLGFLTVSDMGLSDAEMDDVLSLDDDAFDALPDQGSELSVRRMPSLVWYAVKHLLRSYGWLTTQRRHGTVVNQWSHEHLATLVGCRSLQSANVVLQFHSILADYLLGRWAGESKPVKSDGRRGDNGGRNYDRLVPRQPLLILDATGSRYNLWKLDRLPIHLERSNRQKELNEEVLFNFEWIYHKSIAVGYDAVVDDYRLSTDADARLVEVALRRSMPHVGERLQNLCVELIGFLLPYIGTHPNIKRLVTDCDRAGLELCAVVPNFPYIRSPGGPLLHTVDLAACLSAHHSRAMQFALVGEPGRQLLLAKDPTQAEIRVVDPATGERRPDLVTSVGDLYASNSGKYAAIVDFDRERSVKVHRLDVFDVDDPLVEKTVPEKKDGLAAAPTNGQFVGHLVPLRSIAISSRDRHRLAHLCIVGDERICLGVESTVDSRSWLVVGTSVSSEIIYTASYRGRLTCCRSWRPEVRGVAYVGVEDTLYTYKLLPDVKLIGETKLPDFVRSIAFTKNGERGYAVGDRTDRLTVLTINVAPPDSDTGSEVEGRIEAQTTLEIKVNTVEPPRGVASDASSRFDNNNNVSSFLDTEISNSDELLLIRSRRALVVYNIRQGKLVKVIQRPDDVPVEFRLPNTAGRFTLIHFTQAYFTADSKFIVASIFRDIYIYNADGSSSSALIGSKNESPLTRLRAPIGIVSDLCLTSDSNNCHQRIVSITNADSSPLLDVWNVDVALATSEVAIVSLLRDRMTSSIRDVRLTECDSSAFVSTMGSDEIGVFDMSSGQLVDLMTHESVVVEWSATPNGRFVLVSLEQAKPGQFNKIWNVESRQMLCEFGDNGVHSVSLGNGDGFLVLGQTSCSLSDSYHLNLYQITENDGVNQIQLNFDVPFVLDVPFLTPRDRYLIVFHAAGYDKPSAQHLEPRICALTIHSPSDSSAPKSVSNPDVISWPARFANGVLKATTYSPADLRSRGVPVVRRFLHIRPCPANSYNVVVLYTNEASDYDDGDSRGSDAGLQMEVDVSLTKLDGIDGGDHHDCAASQYPSGRYEQPFGFVILDVCSGVICQVIEDCFPASTHFDRLLSTSDHRLYVDQSSNIYDMASGCCVAKTVFQSQNIQLQQFALNEQVLIGTDKAGYLHCVRLSDGQLIASVCVHADVTALRVTNDSRIVVIGCSDGSVLSYVIIDLLTDTDERDAIFSSLGTRQHSAENRSGQSHPGGGIGDGKSTTSNRSWDKADCVSGAVPNYCRPPSAVVSLGPSDKQTLRTLEPDLVLSAHRRQSAAPRSASGSSHMYQFGTSRSQTCDVM